MNIASAAADPKAAPEPSEVVLGLFCTVKKSLGVAFMASAFFGIAGEKCHTLP